VINADLELTWAGLANEELLPRSHSEGPRREFKITRGLRAGYGPSGRIYDLEETIRAAHRWTRERDARAEPFLSGMFTRGEVVFAGSETEAAHDREPVAISTGEVLPHYAGGAKVGLGSKSDGRDHRSSSVTIRQRAAMKNYETKLAH
jgi:hypothetical protein